MYWIVNSIKSKCGTYLVKYTTATCRVKTGIISFYEKIFILPRLKEKMKQILIICNFSFEELYVLYYDKDMHTPWLFLSTICAARLLATLLHASRKTARVHSEMPDLCVQVHSLFM